MSGNFGFPTRSLAPSYKSFPLYCKAREISGSPSLCKNFVSSKFASCKDLFRKDLRGHYGCVNAIEFSNHGGRYVVSGGDDRRVLVWDVEHSLLSRRQTPFQMKGQHRSNIFCTVFDMDNSHVFSAAKEVLGSNVIDIFHIWNLGNDDQAMRHDLKTKETIGIFLHDDPVYSLCVHPDNNLFITACENGKVLMWDVRTASGSTPSQCIARYSSAAFHAAMFNPVDPVLIATANAKKGVQLWDSRAPKKLLQQYSNLNPQTCAMGVKWNSRGTMLTALRRRLPPVLYRIDRSASLVEFDHQGYNNVCTMKSHCFGGDDDQYIISGSDDFNVYVWRIPEVSDKPEGVVTVDEAFLVLSGHRSIVNQVRFNPATHMVISAGVEKVIKVWSPWQLYDEQEQDSRSQDTSQRREMYSHDDYVDLVLSSGRPLTHEYEEGSVEEDPRMLAFFDSLIQHEERGWDSDTDDSFSEEEFYLNFTRGDSDSSSSNNDESRGVSIETVRNIIAGYSTGARQAPDTMEGGERMDEETRAVLRRMGQLRRAMFLRAEAEAAVDGDEEGEDSEAREVLRRMRHLRRAMFLRGFLRAAEGASNNGNEAAAPAPSESNLQYLRDINRVLLQGEVGSSSDSGSDTSTESEPRPRLASPEPDQDASPVRFRNRVFRSTRRYRSQRSRSRSSSSDRRGSRSDTSTASSAAGSDNGRHHSGSSSSASESDTGEGSRRRHKRQRKRVQNHERSASEEPVNEVEIGEFSGNFHSSVDHAPAASMGDGIDIDNDNSAAHKWEDNGDLVECRLRTLSSSCSATGENQQQGHNSSRENELRPCCSVKDSSVASVNCSSVRQSNGLRDCFIVNTQSDVTMSDHVTHSAKATMDAQSTEGPPVNGRVSSNNSCSAQNGATKADD